MMEKTPENNDQVPVLRIRDVYPGSRILIFTHPGSRIQKQQQKREVKKKLDVKPFYVATKFNKIVNYFSFEVLKKKIWANLQRIIELFTKKLSKSSSKYGLRIRDPRSGIRKKPIPDPGVKKAPDPGSATLPGNLAVFRIQWGPWIRIQIHNADPDPGGQK
jgi:hypothetical protein